MSAFHSKLIVEDDGGFPFALAMPLVYESELLKTTLTIAVGFLTDFASIPSILWNILPPVGKYDAAAVVHDFLYQKAPGGITRSEADSVLNEAMKVCGVGAVKRWMIYSGVRVGGWQTWGKYRRGDKPSPPSVVGVA